MKILQRQKRVWRFTCRQCETLLELDETDFETKITTLGNGNRMVTERIATPCPVCGKIWNNIEKSQCITLLIPVEE